MNPESTAQARKVIKLNDSVYQLYRPAGTRSMQVVFFHGFQLEGYDSAHTKTWTSGDGSVWPQTWLVEKFPEAHVLSVSYNRWETSGTMDLFNICENLTSDLLDANREEPRCPIILVGHSFGGLVIKELCVHMSTQTVPKRDSDTESSLENFLNDLKGVFFYATPHRGIREEALALFAVDNQSLSENVKTLSTAAARTESDFSRLSEEYKWRIVGLGESQPIKEPGEVDQRVTAEASSRYGWKFNIAENTNHITITRPIERTQRSFSALMGLLGEIEGVEVGRPGHQTQGIPECHSGLERISREVVQKLCLENRKNARVLGIFGMGGIGKTTIAKAVYNKISKKFQYTCFLDNVKEITSGGRELEDRILRDFHQHGMRKDAINWSTLKGKEILLVMDNVDSEDQLKILPKPGDFGVGSRLIITSRDHSILRLYAKKYDVHEVEFLRQSEAKELFCQLAFGSQAVPEGKQQLEADVIRVLEKCQGLPLTLETAGSYLKGHDDEAEFWEETIVRLGNVKDIKGEAKDSVWASILEMSYCALAEVERQMFLEAGTCFFEQPLERALAVWRIEHGSSSTGWRNLENKSLVKQVRKKKWKGGLGTAAYRKIEYMEVWVHEHFRDWAKKKCEGRMVVGVDEEAGRATDLLKANKVKAGATQTLRLSDRNQKTKLQLSLFNEAENLKYLELEGILHEGSVETCPRLSMLRWKYQFPSQVLPLNVKHMNTLAVLELSRMKIGKEFPEALQNLVNLRILSLCYLEGLDHLPKDFGNLSSLKQLELEGLQISTFPDSFCKLSALTDLSIVSCSSLETLPDLFGKPHRLEYFFIAKSPILKKLPDSFGSLNSLKDVSISDCPMLEVLPENLQGLSSLKRLKLNSCSHSSRLPNLGELKALPVVEINQQVFKLPLQPEKELKLSDETLDKLSFGVSLLSGVENLEVISAKGRIRESIRLPQNFGTLSTLKKLSIKSSVLEELPESFGDLSALTDLTLECERLQRVPAERLKNLCSLERLELTSDRLKRFPESFGTLGSLKSLAIKCHVLEELPESFGNLSALTDLTLACACLERLPKNFKQLCLLERLVIDRCASLRELPNISDLRGLKTLTIGTQVFQDWSAIKQLAVTGDTLAKLSASFGLLSALEDLKIRDYSCSGLRRLPDNFGTLATLKSLKIKCNKLEEIPESFGNLSALTDLTLACACLERLPKNFKQLCSLERLVIDRCARLRELPNISDLRGLKTLTIGTQVFQDWSAIKQLAVTGDTLAKLSASFGLLSALEDLTIRDYDWPGLRRLPDNFGTLATLKSLKIECSELEEIPESVGNLSVLTDLTLACACLERLPKNFKQLCSLERLVIDRCARLRELPNISDLRGLKTLTIGTQVFQDWSAIKQLAVSGDTLAKLWASFGLLSALEDLTIWDYDSSGLRRLPDNFGAHANLKRLTRLTIRSWALEELPESFGNLSALTDLTLQCSLGILPESFRNLCSLERLELTSGRLERLPESFGTLASLKSLAIKCHVLEELPESFGNLSALADLTLSGARVERRGGIFEDVFSSTQRSFSPLRGARLGSPDFPWMRTSYKLPESFGTLTTLKSLAIECSRLEELPTNFGNLSALTDLTLKCDSLGRLPESFRNLCSLERLELTSDRLERLPENFGTLTTLKSLAIECSRLEELPTNFGNLSALTDLTLKCDSLGRLPESFRNLCSLERLELTSDRLERLPENFGTLASLKSLAIICPKLEELPESFGNLSALTDLTLTGGRFERLWGILKDEVSATEVGFSLKKLPENFGTLTTLKSLAIGCSALEELPKNFGNLSALTDLTLWNCLCLKRLPESFKDLCSLERLVIKGCWQLRNVPTVSELGGQGRLTIDMTSL